MGLMLSSSSPTIIIAPATLADCGLPRSRGSLANFDHLAAPLNVSISQYDQFQVQKEEVRSYPILLKPPRRPVVARSRS